ncbi:hypothetical protein LUZ63_019955 [Rhynchospora breviuscula]|uniref:Uncharacterized protein n=1 Tax=Rhynchospora breviuscula TaxID=2022672 RepID=A0A9Q0C7E7_9POAL|nr:hypothetical protein LUZ63_019955 [Rhynchospora breviuscula]
MASSSTIIQMPHDSDLREAECTPVSTQSPMPTPSRPKGALMSPVQPQTPTVVDKTLASIASLIKLLPAGTVLAFQALSPSFTNQGKCYVSNKYLTALLLYFCVLSCVFFAFTDSLVGSDGKVYYGIATVKGFFVFNFEGGDEDRPVIFSNLDKYRIRFIDYIHAFFTVLVFLAVSFSDVSIQDCFFPDAGNDTRELLINLPLGAGFLASIVFVVVPTTRKGLGYTMPSASKTAL